MEGRFTATTNPVSQDLQSEAVIIQPAQQAMSIPRRLARELAHLAPFWCPDQEGEGIYLYSMWRDRDLETGALEAKAEAISHYVERDGLIVELEADWADDDLQAYLVEQANDEIRADADAYYDYRTRG